MFLFRFPPFFARRHPATAAPAPCFHCGLPLPAVVRDRVAFDGAAQPVCCAACAAVAQAVIAAGYGDYYSARMRLAAGADA
jgi:Cu2+-exporting ATPase